MLQDKNKMSSQRLADAMAAEFFHSDRLSNANRDLAVNIVKSLIDYADFLVETDINTINSFASYAASEVSMQASVSSFYPYAAPASSSQPPIPPQPHTTPLYHSAERSTNIQSSVNDYASLTTASVVTKPFFASTGGHVVLEPLSSITEEEPEFTTRISMPNTIPVTQLPGKAVEFDVDKFLMSQKPLLPHDGTGMQAIHEEEDGADAFNIVSITVFIVSSLDFLNTHLIIRLS